MTFNDYLDHGAPLNEAVRHAYCPFCQTVRDAFIVTRTSKGFLMWCHRCHVKKYVKTGKPSLSEAIKIAKSRLTKVPEELTSVAPSVYLPEDFSFEIPEAGLLWLYKYGVSDCEIRQYRFGYSEKRERLILPVFQGEDLVFWQGRYLGTELSEPKYHSVRSKRAGVWFEAGPRDSTHVVLVEDILSAIAVARAGYRAIALLGSYVDNSLIKELLKSLPRNRQVCVWLDPDKRAECVRFAKRIRSLGVLAKHILKPDKDPKEYGVDEVRQFVEGGKAHA